MSKFKNKPSLRSLAAMAFTYTIAFAILLLLMVMVLQTVLLNTSYERMKEDSIRTLASNIEDTFKHSKNLDDLSYIVTQFSLSEDCHVAIEHNGRFLFFGPAKGPDSNVDAFPYGEQIQNVRQQLLMSREPSITIKDRGPAEDVRTLSYAEILNNDPSLQVIIYIFSPLYPVNSTIAIIRTQMIYIALIALVLSLLTAYYISRKFSRPIKDITGTAANLGRGNYNIEFEKGGYQEIDDLSRTLNQVTSELKKTEEYRNDLMANVSHDLKTPLTIIQSNAELIRDISGDNKEKREKNLQVIIDETRRLNQLVTDMLSVTRLHSGKIELEKDNFSFNDCLDSILETYTIFCEQEGYTIKYSKPRYNFIVNGDEDRIKQVITNLINNAIKYGGEDKLITVKLNRKGSNLHFEVSDNGMGIPKSEISHVWDRYYKTSVHHVRNEGGSGLGLSICKEILTLHQMPYGVRSKVNKGSTFWFEMELQETRTA